MDVDRYMPHGQVSPTSVQCCHSHQLRHPTMVCRYTSPDADSPSSVMLHARNPMQTHISALCPPKAEYMNVASLIEPKFPCSPKRRETFPPHKRTTQKSHGHSKADRWLMPRWQPSWEWPSWRRPSLVWPSSRQAWPWSLRRGPTWSS